MAKEFLKKKDKYVELHQSFWQQFVELSKGGAVTGAISNMAKTKAEVKEAPAESASSQGSTNQQFVKQCTIHACWSPSNCCCWSPSNVGIVGVLVMPHIFGIES